MDLFIVFNATFSNISATCTCISWQPALVVEEAGVPGEDYGQATGKLYHLRLRVVCTLFCNIQSQAQTHAILVIGLYELLSNPKVVISFFLMIIAIPLYLRCFVKFVTSKQII
jgi:hypothetical protein